MLTNRGRRFRSPAAWTLVMVLGAPMLAEAQQGGLFPLAPIRRQRVACPAENPVYGLYRQEYFGYHPTCWRKFPAGWGCPSSEAPNVAQAFDPKQGGKPRDPMPSMLPPMDEERGELPPDIDGGQPNAPRDNAMPPLPNNDRSPFNLDSPRQGGEAPPARPAGAAPANPLELPPPASGDKPDQAAAPASPSFPPLGRTDASNVPGPDSTPLLALPDPAEVPAVAAPTAPPAMAAPAMAAPAMTAPAMSAPTAFAGPTPYSAQPPMQAPQRTSLLGGLFSGLRRR